MFMAMAFLVVMVVMTMLMAVTFFVVMVVMIMLMAVTFFVVMMVMTVLVTMAFFIVMMVMTVFVTMEIFIIMMMVVMMDYFFYEIFYLSLAFQSRYQLLSGQVGNRCGYRDSFCIFFANKKQSFFNFLRFCNVGMAENNGFGCLYLIQKEFAKVL